MFLPCTTTWLFLLLSIYSAWLAISMRITFFTHTHEFYKSIDGFFGCILLSFPLMNSLNKWNMVGEYKILWFFNVLFVLCVVYVRTFLLLYFPLCFYALTIIIFFLLTFMIFIIFFLPLGLDDIHHLDFYFPLLLSLLNASC